MFCTYIEWDIGSSRTGVVGEDQRRRIVKAKYRKRGPGLLAVHGSAIYITHFNHHTLALVFTSIVLSYKYRGKYPAQFRHVPTIRRGTHWQPSTTAEGNR